jgi:hypothetical protein
MKQDRLNIPYYIPQLAVMPKRTLDKDSTEQEPCCKTPKVTLASDPTITTDYEKISSLLSQHKTWRYARKNI